MKLRDIFRRTNDPPNFTGKVVVVRCCFGEYGAALEDVRIVKVGFNNFVVGRHVADKAFQQDRWSGVTGWFGVNEIGQMHVFDDIEAARRAYKLDEAGKVTAIDPPESDPELSEAS